jgi:hypothetical protein
MGIGKGSVAATEGIRASIAALDALFLAEAALNAADSGGVDALQRAYEIRLERLGLESTLEAQVAGLKARDGAEACDLQQAMVPPDVPVQERTFSKISTIEEIAGILTTSSGAAAAFVTQSRQLKALPPAMDALAAGELSWQHAKIIADETEGLNHAGATALVAHFLDPEAPNPARGCPARALVPSRLRAKVRAWRERHHPESIEKRHAKSVSDRRVECTRDRDGMAWISAYLPADSAMAILNKTTAIARGLQGPAETRTLTQIKADVFVNRVLAHQTTNTDPLQPVGQMTPTVGPAPTGSPSCEPGMGNSHDGLEGALGLATLIGSDEPAAEIGVVTRQDSTGNHQGSTAPGKPSLTSTSRPTMGSSPIAESGSRTGPTAAAAPGTDTGNRDISSQDMSSPDSGKVTIPRADVIVTVPIFALLGLTDEPAMLDGYGPIPASTARKLLTEGADSFSRVLVDPRDGAPLEIGRKNYRLTKAMKQALNLRDGKCTFPGCNNNSLDNDTDHLTAWQHGGTTGISNLAQLCPKHHRLKHNSRWKPMEATTNEPPGWISPSGRRYKSEHQDWEPPHRPRGWLPEERSLFEEAILE